MSEEDDIEAAANDGAKFLEHYGAKGMRWGVRKDKTSGGVRGTISARKARDKASSKRRVSQGKGKFGENLASALTTSSAQVQKHGGYRNAQAAKAKNLEDYADRLETGRATAKDIIKVYGTTSMADAAKYGGR